MVSDGRTDGQVQIYWTPQEPPLNPWSHKKTLTLREKNNNNKNKKQTNFKKALNKKIERKNIKPLLIAMLVIKSPQDATNLTKTTFTKTEKK